MAAEPSDVATFLGLLVVATLVAAVVRRVNLPYETALVVTGLGLAFIPRVPVITITPEVILTVFLPVLLFHGAYNLHLKDLRVALRLVSFLALPGVLATAGIVGLALHTLTGLSWNSALLFGTIVAATDPVSVLAIFSKLGAPRLLTTIVSGESLFNDGTALVLFALLLDAAQGGHVTLLGGIWSLIWVIGGSLALGAAVGLIGAQVLHQVDDALMEMSITLIMAYGGYILADQCALSGPLETVVAGILLSTRGEKVMSPATHAQADATWEFLGFLANSLLFLLMGLAVREVVSAPGARLGPQLVWPLLVALVAVVLARTVVVRGTARAMAAFGSPMPVGWEPVLVWAGLRGAVSLAAALSLPGDLKDHDLLVILTFGVVLFTLLVQGMTIEPLLRCLHLVEESEAPRKPSIEAAPVVTKPASSGGLRMGTLGPVLALAAQDQGLDDAELARWLGITRDRLEELRQVPLPDPDEQGYRAAVQRIAAAWPVNPRVLQAILGNWWALGLVWPLRAYQRRHDLSKVDLAAYLEIPVDKLDRLGRHFRPEASAEHNAGEIAEIAAATGCNPERLALILADGVQLGVG